MVTWLISDDPVAYPHALEEMEARAARIAEGTAEEAVWLLEHPPLYTAGTSAKPSDLIDPGRFPVYPAGRGGQYTYHGPGQRVAYVMLDLSHFDGIVPCGITGHGVTSLVDLGLPVTMNDLDAALKMTFRRFF